MSLVCISVLLLPVFTTSLQKLVCGFVLDNIFEQYGSIHTHSLLWKEWRKKTTKTIFYTTDTVKIKVSHPGIVLEDRKNKRNMQ